MAEQVRRIVTLLSLIPRQPDTKSIERLIAELSDRGLTINNRRQIERDLVALVKLGYPLVRDDSRPTGWSWSATAPAIDIPCLALLRTGPVPDRAQRATPAPSGRRPAGPARRSA
jgi:hypothetical protein